MQSTRYLIVSLLLTFSFSAFADSCRTFAVGKITVNQGDGGGWIEIHAKNKGTIFGKNGWHSLDGRDSVSWSFADHATDRWYNLALTSVTTGIPITVCQTPELKSPDYGAAPNSSRFSYMLMEN